MTKIKFNNWKFVQLQPINKISAEYKAYGNKFIVTNNDEYYTASYLYAFTDKINVEKAYTISTESDAEFKSGKVIHTVIQIDKNGKANAADYLLKTDSGQYECYIEPEEETVCLRIELMFYSYGKGKVEFSVPEIIETEKKKHRIVNVAVAYFKRTWEKTCDKNLETILKIIDNAAADKNKPDIICFTETAYDRGVLCPMNNKFISADSQAVKKVCKKAKETKMYVIFGFHEEDEENRRYNTVILISDEGEIIHKYRKTHLCYGEIKVGIIPGEELSVYELPFGKIGLLICWDQWFPEAAKELVSKGAEILFISTAGFPENITTTRARENGVYVVASGAVDDKRKSIITDQHGNVISRVTDKDAGYACASIDLDSHEYLRYLSFDKGYGESLYKIDRRDDLYTYYKG